VIYYDTGLEQYFVLSNTFLTEAGFINSFFTKAAPPYDATIEEGPPAPTHFTVRDLNSSAMVLATPITMANYASAWGVTGVPKNRFVGGTVVVEFLYETAPDTYLKLLGVPVDVYESETGYLP